MFSACLNSYRELNRVEEETKQKWPKILNELLIQAKNLKEMFHLDEIPIPAIMMNSIKNSYDDLIQAGFDENPPPVHIPEKRGRKKKSFARNLLERMDIYRDGVLRFIENILVPFDNNLAGVTRSRVLDCVSAIPSIRDVPISAGFSGNGIV